MNSIPQSIQSMGAHAKKTFSFFQRYRVGQILRTANACKIKGFQAVLVFLVLVESVFESRSLYMQRKLHPETLPFAKDVTYRFLNSCHTNWRRFVLLLAARIIRDTIEPLTDSQRRNAIVIDDTLYERSRSKSVELLACVHDHVKHRSTSGFRLLVAGWTDGNTFLPIDFCLLSTENPGMRINEASSSVDARTNGGKQRKLAQMKGTDVVLHLLREIKDAGIPAEHVLFDTWFCSPSSLKDIEEIGYHVVAMTKKSDKYLFRYNGKLQDVKSIFKAGKKRRGRSRYLLSVVAEATKRGESLAKVRLVFVRNRNKRNEYIVLVSTDLSLAEEEIIRLYGKRWDIEVFFKACKSYLRLVRECHSISYDAMTAHIAVVFTRYMLLAVKRREAVDERSIGELFYLSVGEMPDLKYVEALRLVLKEFAEQLRSEYPVENQMLESLLTRFVEKLPSMWLDNLTRQKCA